MKYENNIKQNGNWDSLGQITSNWKYKRYFWIIGFSGTDFYRLPAGSAAIDYGIGLILF